jgi:NTE family protein
MTSVLELPRPVGFVLGGGGSLGASQIGMLRALAEHGVTPDLVTGTSVGSLNGAVLARTGEIPVDRLTAIWTSMTRRAVFPGGPLTQAVTLRKTRTHLFTNDGLATLIDEVLGTDTTFDDCALPLGVVAMDMATTQAVLLRDGPLKPAVLASAAIPGIYPPVEHDGRLLYDGGVVANVPMRQAVAMGAKSLVVLDCAFPSRMPDRPRTIAEVLFMVAMVAMRQQAVLEAPAIATELPVVYLPGPPLIRVSPLDFTHTEELLGEAYVAASAFLHDLRLTGPGLYQQAGATVAD